MVLIHPDDATEVTSIGEVVPAAVRIVENAVPRPRHGLDAVATLQNKLYTAVALNDHVLPCGGEMLVQVGLILDKAEGIGCSLSRFLVLHRARHGLGVGAALHFETHKVIHLRADLVEDHIGLATLGKLLKLRGCELLAVVIVPVPL